MDELGNAGRAAQVGQEVPRALHQVRLLRHWKEKCIITHCRHGVPLMEKLFTGGMKRRSGCIRLIKTFQQSTRFYLKIPKYFHELNVVVQVHADRVLPLQVDRLRLPGQPCPFGQESSRGLRLQVLQEDFSSDRQRILLLCLARSIAIHSFYSPEQRQCWQQTIAVKLSL